MNIAIIGGGLIGSRVLRSLINHEKFNENFHIDVYEKRPELSKGMPHIKDTDTKVINTRVSGMSTDFSNEDGFQDYIDEHSASAYSVEGLVKREAFGDYLEQSFSQDFSHAQVEVIRADVEDIEVLIDKAKSDPRYKLYSREVLQNEAADLSESLQADRQSVIESLNEKIYDAIFLCIGHPVYRDDYKLNGQDKFIRDIYPMEVKLANIKREDKVAIIGTGASSLDAYRYFQFEKPLDHKLYFCTLDEGFQIPALEVKSDKNLQSTVDWEWIEKRRSSGEGLIDLDELVNTVKSDLDRLGLDQMTKYKELTPFTMEKLEKVIKNDDQELAELIEYFYSFYDLDADIFAAFSGSDRDRYLANYEKPYWRFRGTGPVETLSRVVDSYAVGDIEVIYNTKDIKPNENGSFNIYSEDRDVVTVDYVLNTAGFDLTIKENAKYNKLLKNLYDKNIIKSDVQGKYIDLDWPNHRILSKIYGCLNNAFVLGVWAGGTQYKNIDGRRLMRMADRVATGFMDDLE